MFRAAHHLSSGALNCICNLWFTYACGDRPLSNLSGKIKFEISLFLLLTSLLGARGSAVGLRHCATSRKVAGSIPDGVIRIFH